MDELLPCLCCDAMTIGDRGGYEICEICDWEDDPVQAADPDYAGGANTLSLNQHRAQMSSLETTPAGLVADGEERHVRALMRAGLSPGS
ncbi:MAG TPA: CPCC family cysteine-rich protein [Allosphingosinicella sp.]